MTNKIKISIPEPCHENWHEMSPTEKGKFCSSCQKNVIDFTKSSDREIILAYKKEEKLCGRFRISQLDREMIIPKEKKSIWMIAAASIIAFLGLGNQIANAQGKVKIEQTDRKQLTDSIKVKSKKELITYTGTLYDSQNNPLPEAKVKVKRSKTETKTNFDGEFTIKAKKGAILIFQYEGFLTTEFKLGNDLKIKPIMKDYYFIGEVVTAKTEED
ncbi:carboxypeptidase-like protein [Flavobacterium sp. 9]|uniref:carboxypeptidase-like regulatory domain-containing protein n=1 Tax=Flavobacterium sp. 9 TaxID=2035198 RepID=UPI000C188977|nr:carboxypeptidase-like regulatory domain-containing protein [Flavobacterium sp. 9]PIF33932.1 carboxypeptidase-like protein [Flavobacterium sp. 9]